MASPAIPAATLTRMRAGHQAVRWRAVLGLTYQFRAYCCNMPDVGTVLGVTKQPVPVLDLSPNPVCLGNDLTWDLRDSYGVGAAIVSYAIDMGDGTQYFVDHGTHTYAAEGTYDITATIETGVGTSQSVEAQVQVIDCDNPLLITFTYVSQYGGGIWFMDWTADVPTWEERNTGLTGDALYVNSLALRPGDKRLPNTVHELYAATNAGVYRTYNGGRSWQQIPLPEPSNAEFLDAPLATLDELVFYKVVYSPDNYRELWVLAGKSTPDRLWVYHTEDDSLSWESRGLKID